MGCRDCGSDYPVDTMSGIVTMVAHTDVGPYPRDSASKQGTHEVQCSLTRRFFISRSSLRFISACKCVPAAP